MSIDLQTDKSFFCPLFGELHWLTKTDDFVNAGKLALVLEEPLEHSHLEPIHHLTHTEIYEQQSSVQKTI